MKIKKTFSMNSMTFSKNIISTKYISYHSGKMRDHRITLCSNGQKLEFMGYLNNHFVEVGAYVGIYEAGDSE